MEFKVNNSHRPIGYVYVKLGVLANIHIAARSLPLFKNKRYIYQ